MKYSLCFTKDGQLIYCLPEMRKEYKEETRMPSEFGNIIITLDAENADRAIEMAKKLLEAVNATEDKNGGA